MQLPEDCVSRMLATAQTNSSSTSKSRSPACRTLLARCSCRASPCAENKRICCRCDVRVETDEIHGPLALYTMDWLTQSRWAMSISRADECDRRCATQKIYMPVKKKLGWHMVERNYGFSLTEQPPGASIICKKVNADRQAVLTHWM